MDTSPGLVSIAAILSLLFLCSRVVLTDFQNEDTLNEVLAREEVGLAILYSATSGPSWQEKDGWLTGDACGPIPWYGISCDKLSRKVTAIDLSENNLAGTLPGEIFPLFLSLRRFNLAFNALNSIIPSTLFQLRSLEYVSLAFNQFDGTIPEIPGTLTILEELDLSCNSLSGTLPSSLYSSRALLVLNLYQNLLTGSINPLIDRLTNLRELRLYANTLAGTIPSSLGNLTLLSVLELSVNRYGTALALNVLSLPHEVYTHYYLPNLFSADYQEQFHQIYQL